MLKRINKIILTYPKTFALLFGGLSVACLPPYYILIASLISFSGLLHLIHHAQSSKQAFSRGYWFGFGHFALGFSWIGNALLVDVQTYGWLYPICLLASGTFFGLFVALPALLTFKFSHPLNRFFAFAGFWSLGEWLRSFILTGFPWNLIGSALTFDPTYFQTVALWGTYGLSFLFILWSSTPWLFLISEKRLRTTAVIMFLFIPIGTTIYGHLRLSSPFASQGNSDIVVRMVQPSIPQRTKWDLNSLEENFSKHIDLSTSQNLSNVDFVIWGETASPFALDLDHEHRNQILSAIPEQGQLITGMVRLHTTPYGRLVPHNSMLMFNKQGQILDFYDKSHLVPFGEYIPLRSYLPSWIKPITNTIANFEAGKGPRTHHIKNYPPFGVLICYEIIFPHQITNPQDRPQWLINLTNDAWYGDSSGPRQHLIATQLRATEEGLTIVRVANNGISATIDLYGRIIAQIPYNISQIKDVYLPQSMSKITPYSQHGNMIPLTFILLTLLVSISITTKSR